MVNISLAFKAFINVKVVNTFMMTSFYIETVRKEGYTNYKVFERFVVDLCQKPQEDW